MSVQYLTNYDNYEKSFLQDPLNIYRIYISMKLHFMQQKYTYNPKGLKQFQQKTLNKRQDKMFFYFIAEKLDERSIEPFLLAQFMYDPNAWIGDIITDKKASVKIYNSFMNRIELIEQNFLNDIETIKKENKSWKELVHMNDDDHPILFKLVMRNKITPETYTLLNAVFQFIPRLTNKVSGNVLYMLNLRYFKYQHFLKVPFENYIHMIPKNF